MDGKLIHKFRDKVNEENFFREKHRNINGKNYWNIICSAMDWITIAAKGLPNIKLNKKEIVNHLETLNLMQYIITVDILAESIIQLYRVLDGENNYPLNESREIFNHESLNDDKYFKHIRAVFSTHPVNLSSLDGVIRDKNEKFFASWVSSIPSFDYDYNVYLYSNNPNKDELHPFGLNMKLINSYAEKRYDLLNDLIDKVDLYNRKHINTCKETIIPTISDPIEQLEVLFEEDKQRFGTNYGYAEKIGYLYRMLKVDLSPIKFDDFDLSIVHEYRKHLISLIPEVKSYLQNMTLKNIGLVLCDWDYEFEKIYSYLADEAHPLGEAYLKALIQKGPLPMKLSLSNDFDLKQLILDSYLYNQLLERGKPIKFEEMFLP